MTDVDRSQLAPVEIHIAGVWFCPECEVECWCHAVTRERKPGHPSHDPNTPDLVTMPDVVTCDLCNKQFSNEESHPK